MRIVILLSCVLVAAAARAEWLDGGVPGTPLDVQVWGPGEYSVASDTGAWLFQADGGVQSVVSPGLVGTYRTPQGCLVAVERSTGALIGPSGVTGCASSVGSVFEAGTQVVVRRMRHTESGAGYIAAHKPGEPDSRLLRYSPSGASGSGAWTDLPFLNFNVLVGDALAATNVGTTSFALFSDSVDTEFLVATGANITGYLSAGIILAPTSIDLFSVGASAPVALFGTTSGLQRLDLNSGAFSAVPLPDGLAHVTGVDLNVQAGGPEASGFGMAVAQQDGGSVVLSAVPVADGGLSDAGRQWLVNPTFSGVAGSTGAKLREVTCHDARFCVFSVQQAGGDNLLIYRNANPPDVATPAELSVPESSTGFSAFIPVGDKDGDALRVTASGLDEPGLASATAQVQDGGVQLSVSTGAVCTDTTTRQTVRLFASDGRAAHERTVNLPIKVLHTQPPGVPGVSPVEVSAGTGPYVLGATQGAGCAPTGYSWTPLAGAPALQHSGGASAVFPTPESTCQSVSHAYEVRALDSAGASEAGVLTVTVKPWGLPSAPFSPGAALALTAGQEAQVAPAASHPCAATVGFPGVRTAWTLAGGRTLPLPGVELYDGPTRVSSLPVLSERLTVRTQDCTDERFGLVAHHTVAEAGGLSGPEAGVEVEVKTVLEPFASGQLALQRDSSTSPSTLAGTLAVSGLNCLERRNLVADVSLSGQDGTVLEERRGLGLAERWSFTPGEGCSGGTFEVSARLVDQDTGAAGDTDSLTLTTPRLQAALGPLAQPSLVARCGEGARGTLLQTIPAEACTAVRLSWQQVSGPALAAATFSGTQMDIATQDTGLDALVGQRLVLRVDAEAGPYNRATREHEVPITVEPFVDVTHEVEKPAGSESGLLGVTVGLRNTTACGVTDVLLEERLEGLTYVPDSARLDGQPVPVEVAGDVLRVRGLALEGSGSRRLTYVARPTLLGTPRPQAQVLLREVPVSEGLAPLPPASGCGCSGGGSGTAALGLLALLGLRRRRGQGPAPATARS